MQKIEEIKRDIEKMEEVILSFKEKVNLLYSEISGEKVEVAEKKVYFCPSCGFSAKSNVEIVGTNCWKCKQDKFKKIDDYGKEDFIDLSSAQDLINSLNKQNGKNRPEKRNK